MTTYYFELKQCPACETKLSCMQVGSCNTFGARFYTDGYVEGPMHDETTKVAPCPKCNHVLWIHDLPTLERSRSPCGSDNNEENPVYEVKRYKTQQFEDLLSGECWSDDQQEVYVRIRAWWYVNHTYRNDHDKEFSLNDEQAENLRSLLLVLGRFDSNEVLMRAEIFRELGMFDECIQELNIPTEENFQQVVKLIVRLAEEKCRAVKEIIWETE